MVKILNELWGEKKRMTDRKMSKKKIDFCVCVGVVFCYLKMHDIFFFIIMN